jgi:thiol-disulfide isomerase/thioredoxin
MSRTFLACAALAAAITTLPAGAVAVGDAAPALVAPQAGGESFSLAELRGRVVYVDFWASWCAPCRAAMPEYEKLWKELAPQGLTVVGVNVDSKRELALRAITQVGASFPVVFDPQGQWPKAFDLPAMPTAYLVDRKGVVRHIHAGFRAGDARDVRARIEALLQEPA